MDTICIVSAPLCININSIPVFFFRGWLDTFPLFKKNQCRIEDIAIHTAIMRAEKKSARDNVKASM